MDPARDWTRTQAPALHGRRISIAGANSGSGYEAAQLLADRGAAVTLDCRVELHVLPARARVDLAATDLHAAGMLWDRSEQLTGVRYGAVRVVAS